MDALAELELRVGDKWMTVASERTPDWPSPDIDFDMGSWQDLPIPDDVPQFPRERWAAYPTKRMVVLMLCDHALDFELNEEQWIQVCLLMQYGGKTRLS